MADEFLRLSVADRKEALQVAASSCERPSYLLEKDIWVVWSLSVLFDSELGDHLSFKGGTSLSKAYKAITRFSEDIDVTYDVRQLIPEFAASSDDALPATRSQSEKWTKAIRAKLPVWISEIVIPIFNAAIERNRFPVSVSQEEEGKLFVKYEAHESGYGYVQPRVMLDFGARATGEPTEGHDITCDAAPHLKDVLFPAARVRAMKLERTFWEKATAAHVYCLQGALQGERFARHWYDLAKIARTERYPSALSDRSLALSVANHKAMFFREAAADGTNIDYTSAVKGELKMVPEGTAYALLADDYRKMIDVGLLEEAAPAFAEVMKQCKRIEDDANGSTAHVTSGVARQPEEQEDVSGTSPK